MDGGVERVEDEAERAVLRKQARGVRLRSLALAAVLTAIAFAIP